MPHQYELLLSDTSSIKQINPATTVIELITKGKRKRIFLDEMNLELPFCLPVEIVTTLCYCCRRQR